MIRRIRWVPNDEYAYKHIDPPIPAKQAMPQWYRLGEMVISKNTGKVANVSDNDISGGLKSCLPFLDAMISGYFITSWEDFYIKTTDKVEEFYSVIKNEYTDKYEKYTPPNHPMIDERVGDIGHTIPRPEGHCKNHMIFSGQWGARLPKGWSLLLTHPLNRFDLPFATTSGIIDSDEWWAGGNIPFFFKENFEGIIPKGTPFAQLIPIKRSSWTSYTSVLSVSRNTYLADKARSVPIGWYKKNIWTKKKYD